MTEPILTPFPKGNQVQDTHPKLSLQPLSYMNVVRYRDSGQ